MIKRILLLAGLCAVAWAPVANAQDTAREAANKALVLKVVKVLFNEHKVDQAFDKYISPDYIQHNAMVPPGAAATKAFFKKFYAANPHASAKVSHILADGNLVAVHYLAKSKPSEAGFAVVDIFRIKGGKLAEHWDVMEPMPKNPANDNGKL